MGDFGPLAELGAQLKGFSLYGLLVLAVMVSGVAVIYLSHHNRQVFNLYQDQLQQRDALKIEWGKLLLEENTLASHSEIEQRAVNELGMQVPDAKQVVIVKP